MHPTAHTPIPEPANALLFKNATSTCGSLSIQCQSTPGEERAPLAPGIGRKRKKQAGDVQDTYLLCWASSSLSVSTLWSPPPVPMGLLEKGHPTPQLTPDCLFKSLSFNGDKDGARGTGCFSQPFSSSGCHVGCFVISISGDITVPWMASVIILASLRSRCFLIK